VQQPEPEGPVLIKPPRAAGGTTTESNTESSASKAPEKAERSAEQSKLNREELAEAARELAKEIKNRIKPSRHDLQFEVDEESNTVVISVIDSDTRKVIRTIPNEDFVARVAAKFIESGHLVSSAA